LTSFLNGSNSSVGQGK